MGTAFRGALLAAATLVVGVAPAQAQEIADANCAETGAAFDNQTGGSSRWAQTFTVQSVGTITSAQVRIVKNGTPGDWTIAVVDAPGGVPGQTTLASDTIADSSLPAGPQTLAARFATPLAVSPGEQYALMITRPASNDLTVRTISGDPSCLGALFIGGPPPAIYSALNNGNDDMVFAVFGEPPDSAPPDAQITNGPKAKTRKKQATFEFGGTDARAIADFECSLDGGAFAACTSPHTVKVKKGKHTFSVRATDTAGNVDPSPATFAWKVKKKRKKR